MAYRHMLACASWRSKTTEPKTDWRLKTDLLGKFLNLAQVRVVVHVISADHTDRHLNYYSRSKGREMECRCIVRTDKHLRMVLGPSPSQVGYNHAT